MYIVRDREAGNEIERFETVEKARVALVGYEDQDKSDDTYEEDFYEIYDEEREKAVK